MFLEAIMGVAFIGSWLATTSNRNALEKANREFAEKNGEPYWVDKKGRKRFTKTGERCFVKVMNNRMFIVDDTGYILMDVTEAKEAKENIERYNEAKERGDLLWQPLQLDGKGYWCSINETPETFRSCKEWYIRHYMGGYFGLPSYWFFWPKKRKGLFDYEDDPCNQKRYYDVTSEGWLYFDTIEESNSYWKEREEKSWKRIMDKKFGRV